MPELDEIKKEVMLDVDSELDAWDTFYKKYKQDYEKISLYEKRIKDLEDELNDRDKLLQGRWEKERGVLLSLTIAYLLAAAFVVLVISNTINVWLYFTGGVLIGLGGFALLYLWTR